MEDKLKKISEYLLLPGAIVALIAGLISIYKDTGWYIYIPLLIITVVLIIVFFLKNKEVHAFKVLSQTMKLEFKDNDGKDAIFTNTARLKALKNGAQNFDYLLYCDGDIKEIETREGSVAEIKKEGGRLLVKTNVDQPLKKDEEVEHTLTAKYINGFPEKEEFWQTAKNAHGTHIQIIILTVPNRPIKEYKAFKIIGHTKILLEQQPVRIFSGASQGIALDFNQAQFLEKYRVEWTW